MNRLAVVFFRRKKFDLSYLYHGKHGQQADEADRFVAIYNAGISSRLLGEYERASQEFKEAFKLASARSDFESMSLTHGQLAISSLLKREMDQAKDEFKKCYNIAKQLRANKM